MIQVSSYSVKLINTDLKESVRTSLTPKDCKGLHDDILREFFIADDVRITEGMTIKIYPNYLKVCADGNDILVVDDQDPEDFNKSVALLLESVNDV